MWVQRALRNDIEAWVEKRKKDSSRLPTRKEAKAAFPDAPLKVIRKVLQSARDSEG